MIDDGDREILEAFIEEANELIDEVEPSLVELQQSQDTTGRVDQEMINSIFRPFHSMKGSAGVLELHSVVKLTHKTETLLDIFRKGLSELQPPDVNLLLKSIDLTRLLLGRMEETFSDQGYETEVEAVVQELGVSIDAKNSPTPEVEPEQAPETDQETDEKADAEDQVSIVISDEIRGRFLEEAEEMLEAAEQNMLAVADSDSSDVSEALRALHSFKGNCGFMGLKSMETLTHRTETILEMIADNEKELDDATVSLILETIDRLRGLVVEFADGESGEIDDLDQQVGRLEALYLDKPAETAAPVAKSAPEPAPAPPPEKDDRPKGGFIDLSANPKQTSRIAKQKAAENAAAAATPAPKPAKPAPTNGAPTNPPAASDPAKAAPQKAMTSKSIRVDLQKLDTLLNLVGELVIAETMVTNNPDLEGFEMENFERSSHHLRRITTDLQDIAMSVRMIPVAGTLRRMVRLVHDLSSKAKKKVKLELVGEETEMDKTVIEQIADPLVHIVRNAVDHGLESTEDRKAAGKSDTGTVTIEARHESGEVWIMISDDGGGLDRERILNKAIERGLVEGDGSGMRDEEVYKLVFEPGFSTAAQVTEISGRGVGMDVVKRNIEQLNGRIDIRSEIGKGSTFVLRIPLTLAIIEGMLVRVGDATYTIPILAIREAFRPVEGQITITPEGQEVVQVRDEMISVVRLHAMYNKTPDFSDLTEGILIIVDDNAFSAAIFVDEILGQQQTVIKGLTDYVGKPTGVSGCTILGDGTVSLILDIGTLLEGAASYAGAC